MPRKYAPKKKTEPPVTIKTFPNWIDISGTSTRHNDWFHSRQQPNKNDLVGAFEDLVFACVNLISHQVSDYPIRLYSKPLPGAAKPKHEHRTITSKAFEKATGKRFAYMSQVHEILNHPVLDLLSHCNSYHNYREQFQNTQNYLELAGNAYWLMQFDTLKRPREVYILPAQNVQPIRDTGGMVEGWHYSNHGDEKDYKTSEIIHFKFSNPADPFAEGYAPADAAWSRIDTAMKQLSYINSLLANQARIDGILSIKDSLSPIEGERYAKDFMHRHRGRNQGGIEITDGTVDFKPMQYPPTDMAQLEMYKETKTTICNIFGIPPDIFELGESNRATADASLYRLAKMCIKPRLNLLVDKLNDKLLPYYDKTGMLFFAADECVPEDKEYEQKQEQMLLQFGVILRDEARLMNGFSEAPWAQVVLTPSGMLQQQAPQAAQVQAQPAQSASDDQANKLRATVGGSAQIMALQVAVYAGQMPREAAIANAIEVFGYSAQEADNLFPIIVMPLPAVNAEASPPVAAVPEPIQAEPKQEPVPPAAKAYKPVDIAPMETAIRKFFAKQYEAVLSQLHTKATGDSWFDIKNWTDDFANEMIPYVQLSYDEQAQQSVAKLGMSLDQFNVVQPKLKEAVEQHTFVFAQSTNETTSMDLADALSKLKEELTEGLVQGEFKQLLTDRVKGVFDNASAQRAVTIAQTESSRAQSKAIRIVGDSSDLVKGYRWKLSSDACPECKELVAETPVINKGEHFKEGEGDYGVISGPPLHARCRCTMSEIVSGVND